MIGVIPYGAIGSICLSVDVTRSVFIQVVGMMLLGIYCSTPYSAVCYSVASLWCCVLEYSYYSLLLLTVMQRAEMSVVWY